MNYFKITLALILLLSLTSCKNEEYEEKALIEDTNTLKVAIASDTHLLSPKLYEQNQAFYDFVNKNPILLVEYTSLFLDCLIQTLIENDTDILILSGDLTTNGELQSHLDLSYKLNYLEENGVEAFVIGGNHDINNPWAMSFNNNKMERTDNVSPEQFKEIYKNFGYEQATSVDNDSLSYYVDINNSLGLLMIDSNYYKYNTEYPHANSKISSSTLNWIEEILEQNNDKDIITVSHHTVLTHNKLFIKNYTIDENEKISNLLKEYNNNLIFSGHLHIHDVVNDDDLIEVVSSPLAVYPNAYGLLTVTPTTFTYETKYLDVENYVIENDINDSFLMDYNNNAYERYKSSNISILEGFDNLDEDKQLEIFNTFSEINFNFMTGNEYKNDKFINTEAYNELINKEGFISIYVKSITNDNPINDNYFEMDRKNKKE